MEKKRLKEDIDRLASWLLFLCVVALIVVSVTFAIQKIYHSNSAVRVNIVLDEGALSSDSTMYAKDGIDSLISIVSKHEQALSDKYQYMLEQNEMDEKMLSLGTLLVGIVLSVFGFFGYKSMKAVEEKAENVAKSTAEITAKEEVLNYLKKNLGTFVDNYAKQLFDSPASAQLKKELQLFIISKMEEIKRSIISELKSEQEEIDKDKTEIRELTQTSQCNDRGESQNGKNINEKEMEDMLQ